MIYLQSEVIAGVTLEEAKAHLRVDHNLENDLIQIYINAATTLAEHTMNRELIFRADPNCVCKSLDAVPNVIKTFILVTVGDMYAKRENFSEKNLSTTFKHLLDPYIIYNKDPLEEPIQEEPIQDV